MAPGKERGTATKMPHRVRTCLGRGTSDPCTTKRYGNSKALNSLFVLAQ
jgi:hypothetical protein